MIVILIMPVCVIIPSLPCRMNQTTGGIFILFFCFLCFLSHPHARGVCTKVKLENTLISLAKLRLCRHPSQFLNHERLRELPIAALVANHVVQQSTNLSFSSVLLTLDDARAQHRKVPHNPEGGGSTGWHTAAASPHAHRVSIRPKPARGTSRKNPSMQLWVKLLKSQQTLRAWEKIWTPTRRGHREECTATW